MAAWNINFEVDNYSDSREWRPFPIRSFPLSGVLVFTVVSRGFFETDVAMDLTDTACGASK